VSRSSSPWLPPRSFRRLVLPAILLLLLPVLLACGGDDDDEPTVPPPTVSSATIEAPVATPSAEPSPPVSTPAAASPVASPDEAASPVPTPITEVALTPGPAVTAEEILRFGAGRMANVASGHFKATIDGTVYIDDSRSLQLVSAEGNVVRPDRVQTQFRLRIGEQAISTIRLITIGDDAWMTDLISGDWVPAAIEFGYDASILFDPVEGLAPVMLNVDNPVRLDDETLNGRDVYVIEATAGEDLIGPITSNTLTGYPVTIRAWIDQETGDLLKIVLIEPPSPENDDPSTWTLELSQIDQEFTIEPPDVED
jgi:hypothetical protein